MNYLILVNKDNKVPVDYEVSLVEVKTKLNGAVDVNRKIFLEKRAAAAWLKFKKFALKKGIKLEIVSGYRDIEYQKRVKNYYLEKIGEEATKIRVAEPYESEHHTALALDYAVLRGNQVYYVNDNDYEYNWIINNAYEYGFILRYPKDKENVTKYRFEPWHLRYVGFRNARKIYQGNYTLEEYIENSHL